MLYFSSNSWYNNSISYALTPLFHSELGQTENSNPEMRSLSSDQFCLWTENSDVGLVSGKGAYFFVPFFNLS
jgi:hypothetical protein